MAPVPLGPLSRKTGSRLGDRHLRPLRGGLGRDPVTPIGSQLMGVGESSYSVPALARFPLVRTCRTTLREALSGYSSGAPVRGGSCRTEVPDLARGLGRRPIGKWMHPGRVPWSGPGGEPERGGCPWTQVGSGGAAISSWGPCGPGGAWDRAPSGPMGLDVHRPTLSPWVRYPRY